jgi:sulfonate transport system ATP-binding protein
MALMTRNPRHQTSRPNRPDAAEDGTGRSVATVTELHRSFGTTHVLRGLDLEIRGGEFVALLGRSGSGKSTLLRSLAGLDPASPRELTVHGAVSVAFQEPRLLPWRTVEDNVALALANGPLRRIRREHARRSLDEVGLTEKRDAWPLSLSGGQAQRVSLARALVSKPNLLLLDEPFSALDALTRIEMHRLVVALWKRHRPGVLLVTHDVDEALALADRVLVLDQGQVAAQWSLAVPRGRRNGDPQISAIRTHVLEALGVDAGTRNPRTERPTESGAA